jgi:large subunit ribosomal protein L25
MTNTNKTLTIALNTRSIVGNDVRKLRRSGRVPAVIYGNKSKDILIDLDYNQFVKLYKESGKTHIIDLEVNNSTYHCLIHDIDVDPVKGTARHIDFLSVDLKQKVTVSVPVVLVGEAPAVIQGAILVHTTDEVEVEALPNKVPDHIEADLSKLMELHDNIHVSDLPTSSEYTILTEGDVIIASVVEPEKEEVIVSEEAPATTDATSAPTAESTKE